MHSRRISGLAPLTASEFRSAERSQVTTCNLRLIRRTSGAKAVTLRGHDLGMYAAAPRVDRRLLEALGRIDRPDQPIAETHRRSREEVAKLGVPRPSYELVRLVIHEARREKERRRRNRDTVLRVLLYQLPPDALNHLDKAPSRARNNL